MRGSAAARANNHVPLEGTSKPTESHSGSSWRAFLNIPDSPSGQGTHLHEHGEVTSRPPDNTHGAPVSHHSGAFQVHARPSEGAQLTAPNPGGPKPDTMPWNAVPVPGHIETSNGLQGSPGGKPKPSKAEPRRKMSEYVVGLDGTIRPRRRPGRQPKTAPPATQAAPPPTAAQVAEALAAAPVTAVRLGLLRPDKPPGPEGRPRGTKPSNTGKRMPDFVRDKDGSSRPRKKPGPMAGTPLRDFIPDKNGNLRPRKKPGPKPGLLM